MKKNSFMNRIIKLFLVVSIIITSLFSAGTVKGAEYTNPLTVTIISPTQIRLGWEDNISNEYSYRVERRTGSGGYTDLGTGSYVGGNSKACYYTDYSVEPGKTYTYVVKVYYSVTSSYTYTNEVITTSTTVATPSSLSINDSKITSSSIEVSWSYNNTSYDTLLERKTESGEWTAIGTFPAGIFTYIDNSVSENKFYYYRVSAAYNTNIRSAYWPDENGIKKYTKVANPGNLYGYAASPTDILVSWVDNSTETIFILERKSGSGGAFTPIAVLPANTTSYLDKNLTANTRYIYRIKAETASNRSDYSEELTVLCSHLETPFNYSVTAISGTQAELRWVDYPDNISSYEIWRKEGNSGQWEKYSSVGYNATSFIDRDLSQDTQYYYKIRAVGKTAGVYSAFTNELSTWTILLNEPTNLHYTRTSDSDIMLSWTDNANNESGYKVERKVDIDGQWSEIAVLSANTTSFSSNGLNSTTRYFYRVKAFDNTIYNSSAYSEVIEVLTGTIKPPVSLSIEPVSSSQIRLEWEHDSSNCEGFVIERRRFGEGFKEIARVDKDVGTFLDSNLYYGKYYYRIMAYDNSGVSEVCNSIPESVFTKKKVKFLDLDDYGWAENQIENLASRGALFEKNENRFYPGSSITRAEYVNMLVRAFNLDKIPVGSFKDVNIKHKYYKEVMTASKMGIISGNASGYFYPDQYITREDAALFTAKLLKSVGKTLPVFDTAILDEFTDKNQIAPDAVKSVASICGERIMSGKTVMGDRIFDPKGKVIRAEAAVIIFNVIDR